MSNTRLQEAATVPEGTAPDFVRQHLIGSAPAFLYALTLVRKSARCDATVLIQGETGTGKELAARAIHYLGARKNGPFVPVNCGAIPETLIESEFFGHVRGAFTDAKETREGVAGQAQGGTLFLDELEALSPRGQVVLLRFLQDRTFTPVGSERIQRADVRVIGSTNADLSALAAEGKYRLDLLFRLDVLSLKLPPLRERPGDATILAQYFAERLASQYGRTGISFAPEATRDLERRRWPGNVRELENLIHRELLLAEDSRLVLRSLSGTASFKLGNAAGIPRFREAKARMIADFERDYLADLLHRTGGNVSLAARLAGKDRSRLAKLVKKYGLQRLTLAKVGAS